VKLSDQEGMTEEQIAHAQENSTQAQESKPKWKRPNHPWSVVKQQQGVTATTPEAPGLSDEEIARMSPLEVLRYRRDALDQKMAFERDTRAALAKGSNGVFRSSVTQDLHFSANNPKQMMHGSVIQEVLGDLSTDTTGAIQQTSKVVRGDAGSAIHAHGIYTSTATKVSNGDGSINVQLKPMETCAMLDILRDDAHDPASLDIYGTRVQESRTKLFDVKEANSADGADADKEDSLEPLEDLQIANENLRIELMREKTYQDVPWVRQDRGLPSNPLANSLVRPSNEEAEDPYTTEKSVLNLSEAPGSYREAPALQSSGARYVSERPLFESKANPSRNWDAFREYSEHEGNVKSKELSFIPWRARDCGDGNTTRAGVTELPVPEAKDAIPEVMLASDLDETRHRLKSKIEGITARDANAKKSISNQIANTHTKYGMQTETAQQYAQRIMDEAAALKDAKNAEKLASAPLTKYWPSRVAPPLSTEKLREEDAQKALNRNPYARLRAKEVEMHSAWRQETHGQEIPKHSWTEELHKKHQFDGLVNSAQHGPLSHFG